MVGGLLDPRIVRMPSLAEGEWLNGRSLTPFHLRGQVVLIDFWDYTCINCLRTLPYLKQWHQRYAEQGLVILGIHTPEFGFAQFRHHLEAAIAEHEIPYPILLDNHQENWSRFATKAWPTKFLIDPDGYIRLKRQGEGYYQEMERAIQTLLRLRRPDVALPDLLPPLRAEDAPGAVCYRPTPELYAGFQGGGLFGGALGNPEGYLPNSSVIYQLPPVKAWQDVLFGENGRSFVRVDRPRLFNLVNNPDFASRTLRFIFQARGLALYTFTFTGCVVSPQNPHDADTFQMP